MFALQILYHALFGYRLMFLYYDTTSFQLIYPVPPLTTSDEFYFISKISIEMHCQAIKNIF